MTSHSESEGNSTLRARAKVIYTKRDYFNIDKMEHGGSGSLFVDNDASDEGSDKDNPSFNNGAGTETDNASPYTSEDEEVQIPKGVIGRASSNNNDSGHRLLPVNVAVDESARVPFNNSLKRESGDVAYKYKAAGIKQEDIDFVDMAMSREETEVFAKDQTDADSVQIDTYKQKQRKTKPAPKGIKYNAKERNQSKLKPSVSFGWFDVLIGILAVTLFFVDIGTDIELAVHYFRSSLWVYGGVTTGFIVGPSLVTCFLGLHWYLLDYNKEKEVLEKLETMGKKSKAYQTPGYIWFLRFFFTLLQCGPVIRYMSSSNVTLL